VALSAAMSNKDGDICIRRQGCDMRGKISAE